MLEENETEVGPASRLSYRLLVSKVAQEPKQQPLVLLWECMLVRWREGSRALRLLFSCPLCPYFLLIETFASKYVELQLLQALCLLAGLEPRDAHAASRAIQSRVW